MEKELEQIRVFQDILISECFAVYHDLLNEALGRTRTRPSRVQATIQQKELNLKQYITDSKNFFQKWKNALVAAYAIKDDAAKISEIAAVMQLCEADFHELIDSIKKL